MSLSPPTFAALLPSATAGDEARDGEDDDRLLVQELYREHSLSLVRQLTRKTGCRELARDLANETFVRLLRMTPGNSAVSNSRKPSCAVSRRTFCATGAGPLA